MAKIAYTSETISDLSKIADYTLENWGLAQARKYRDGFIDTFKALMQDNILDAAQKSIIHHYDHSRMNLMSFFMLLQKQASLLFVF